MCLAGRDFGPGDQVFIFYGARTCAEQLIHNGFVDTNNSHDALTLKLGLSKSDPLAGQRASLLCKLHILPGGFIWMSYGSSCRTIKSNTNDPQMTRSRGQLRSSYELDRSRSTDNCWPSCACFPWRNNRSVKRFVAFLSLSISCDWLLIGYRADWWLQSDHPSNLMHEECGIETEVESKAWSFLKTRCQLLVQLYPTTKEV